MDNYLIKERIEKDGYEQAILYFETEYTDIDCALTREEKFMSAIKDGWIPVIQILEGTYDNSFHEFLMKRKLKDLLID